MSRKKKNDTNSVHKNIQKLVENLGVLILKHHLYMSNLVKCRTRNVFYQ